MSDQFRTQSGSARADKREQLVKLLREGRSNLSLQQQRLWFLQKLTPDNPYHTFAAFELRGNLDIEVLQRALAGLCDRHESLRTQFIEIEGRPLRLTNPGNSGAVSLRHIDLGHLNPVQQEAEIRRLAVQEATEPFDLTASLLWRVTLVRLNPQRSILFVTMHELIADDLSATWFVHDLAELYAHFTSNEPADLPELAVSFSDFVTWEQQFVKSDTARERLTYWRNRLAGVTALDLPTDRPRPKVQSFRGAVVSTRLPAELVRGMKELAQQADADLSAVLMAAYQILLGRYGRTEDVTVGIPVPGRDLRGTERLIGCFANMVVVRTDLTGSIGFRQLVGRVRDAYREACAHVLPFEQLVQELRPQRDLSRSPMFQAAFVMREDVVSLRKLTDLTIAPYSVDPGIARYDVTMTITSVGEELELSLTYNTDLFDRATAERMLANFRALLERVTDDPERPATTLSTLSHQESQLILEWGTGPSQPIPPVCVHQLIEEQVVKTPHAVAVEFGEKRWTYEQLNRCANQIAHYLHSLGVGRGSLVGIFCERSPELVAAVLGTLKAGAAYVPLDPAYPTERLAFMLEDSGASVLLTQERLQERLPKQGVTVVCLDRDWVKIGQLPATNPDSGVGPDGLAYVIYTSGSTGKPKGTLLTHRGVVNYLTWAVQAYEVWRGGGAPVHSSIAFDLTVTSLFTPLICGRTVTLVPEDRIGVDSLCRVLERGGFSLVKLTPSHLELISQGLPADKAAGSTTRLVVGGEALTGEHLRFWREHAPETLVVNEYGPTETVVGCCVYEVPAGEVSPGPVPIGRPIANTRLYVLDANMQPVPIGVPGELYIGGAGVAKGYLNRPDLTAERFVPDPFSADPSARLYRTGDLVRYRPDGNLEFLGRIDDQVKVRGYRIELGEIEAVLQQHPGVRAAVVTVREDVPGDKRLVGYVVRLAGEHPSRTELLDFVSTKLPEYMVPTTLVFLDELPLTPNGKVDRKALPAPDTDRPELRTSYVPPRTPLERELAETVASLLGLDRVGIQDNIFELGARSLQVAQLSARLLKAYNVDLPVQQFFQVPTVEGLARVIEIYRTEGREAALQATDVVDLLAEAVLDPSINPTGLPLANVTQPQRIFLTGVTGFLGSFLLHELLDQTKAEIYCLVRAAGPEEGRERIKRIMQQFRIWDESQQSRIIPVIGDLAQPRLGLAAEEFANLAATIDSIYHSGALVNFVYPYSALKPTNVLGTQEVLRLACTTKAKAVHFVSALDVFLARRYFDRVIREDEATLPGGFPAGYVQSKWVAEKLVTIAKSRGLPTCVYRPWIINAHSQTGVCHTTDYLIVALKGCLQLGMFPDHDVELNVMPIDWVSKAMIHISLQPSSFGKVFHFSNPKPAMIGDVYRWIQSFGYDFEVVDYDIWRRHALQVDASNALSTITPLIRQEEPHPEQRYPRFDCSNTFAALEGTGLVCPPVSEELTHTCLRYLVEIGFIDPPTRSKAV